MYEIETLVDPINSRIEELQEYFLDLGVITSDDYKTINITARKANHIQELGRAISVSYPLKDVYDDSDVELIVTRLIEQ
ncbi:hypothetical protein L6M23_000492 [Salmonella enterica subsp. enterica serovar Matopeni]|uniref:hypothetical protein n=1 Tax=Citrobacter portucalensis TaxID=1639133 RepID=UPI00123C5683|nr:hypothetical protein [Citrobacter portucalensis]EAT2573066.1 hypothetical protein [Salmonella enterica]EBF8505578.1 hypothetical protein [Salmonella enterica subsp. enterica serovar Matopeni]ECD1129017.1 hypothetical protein [Salmonella enterica subsp. enterica serovar Matopeni]ECD6681766.1 hypothetical protein [Salmonella enterica subsp. enterica serovar Matopeni]ECP8394704.1 hypothetical protein [Salmonella enterica subsp. enterica serovar Matopeni]